MSYVHCISVKLERYLKKKKKEENEESQEMRKAWYKGQKEDRKLSDFSGIYTLLEGLC